MKRTTRRRSAFLLVFCLGMILLAVSTLGLAAAKSAAVAVQARKCASELQRRWGMRTVERTISEFLPLLLEDKDSDGNVRRIAQRDLEFSLGAADVRVTIAEEDAKLNLNVLYERLHHDVAQVAPVLRSLLSGDPVASSVLVRPLNETDRAGANLPPFVNLDQFLERKSSSDRYFPKRITLWGEGRVDVATADALTIKAACQDAIPPNKLAEILVAKQDGGAERVGDLLQEVELDAMDSRDVGLRLTDKRSTFSLELRIADDWQQRRRMIVVEVSPDGRRRVAHVRESL